MIRISPVAYFLRALPGVLRVTWYDAKFASSVATAERMAEGLPVQSEVYPYDSLCPSWWWDEDCEDVEVDIPED